MQVIADGNGEVGRPPFDAVKGVHADTPRDKRAAGLGDALQGALDSVKNVVQDAGRERHGNGVAGRDDLFTRTQPGSFLINLYRRHVLVERDDLPDQFFLADVDHFGHLEARVPLQVNDGAVDAVNRTKLIHFIRQCPHLPGT